METTKLKAAILGVKGDRSDLLQTVSESQYFELIAIADKDADLAKDTGQQYDCQWFDDYRQMVMSCKADCLLIAAGLYAAEPHVRLAIKKNMHIFKLCPPAANFTQLSELLNLARNNNVRFAVSAPLRFFESFNEFKLNIAQTNQNYSLLTADCNYNCPERPAWHNDPELAGGGVLLRDGYQIIDLLVSSFDMPQQVYSLMTNNAADKQQRHALTEDIASVVMKFKDNFSANITLRRNIAPATVSQRINCYGKDQNILVTDTTFEITDSAGNKIKKKNYKTNTSDTVSASLDNFALSILQPNENKLVCQPNEHLKNMATIEAAYLSSRTAMPEGTDRLDRLRNQIILSKC